MEPGSSDADPDDPQGSAPESAQPRATGNDADVAENTVASSQPQPTEFQKVWDRHKQGAAEGADNAGQEREGSFDWNADEEPPAEAEASQPADYQQVSKRLRREQGVARSEENGDGKVPSADAAGVPGVGAGNFERVWERLNQEREERSEEGAESTAGPRGLGNLPTVYRMTIEDRDGTPVDLVALHRALMAFAPADDISLTGYAKGTATVGLRTEGDLDLDRLASVIGTAMARQCEVIPQDQGKLFLRLSGEEEGEE